jgi:L-lactate dehydrogenase complex protein LldG
MRADQPNNDDARTAILDSIRARLAESALHGTIAHEAKAAPGVGLDDGGSAIGLNVLSENGRAGSFRSPVEMFRERLEAVGGHCVVARDEREAARALERIVTKLQATSTVRRVALSDAPLLAEIARLIEAAVEEVTISPNAAELFGYDAGVTTAQAAIAETGTLVLESDKERHRLVSLLPPVHIALINSKDICLTMGDALKRVRVGEKSDMDRAITFITGPSRTADIELTLTVGVHGPKELYVIIIDDSGGDRI